MAYGKRKLFKRKSSKSPFRRRSGRKYAKKSIKDRVAKVEKVLRVRKPELKHRHTFAPDVPTATKAIKNYPDPNIPYGAQYGPNDSIWNIAKGTNENERVGGSVSKAWGFAQFQVLVPHGDPTFAPGDPGDSMRKVRVMVVQMRTAQKIYSGAEIFPYTDILATRMFVKEDPEKKELKGYYVMYDKVHTLTSSETNGPFPVGNPTFAQQHVYKQEIKLNITPHWPLQWDDDMSPTQCQNPVFIYFFADHQAVANGAAEVSVRMLFAQHYWRDNS